MYRYLLLDTVYTIHIQKTITKNSINKKHFLKIWWKETEHPSNELYLKGIQKISDKFHNETQPLFFILPI